MLPLHVIQYCKYLQSTCVTPKEVISVVSYLLCYKSSKVILSVPRLKSQTAHAQPCSRNLITQKKWRKWETTKIISKGQEIVLATLDDTGQQPTHNLNLTICST